MNTLRNFLVCLISLAFTISPANGAIMFEHVQAAPGDPNSCFRERDNLTLSDGQSITQPNCTRVSCNRYDEMYLMSHASCGVVELSKDSDDNNCTLVSDSSKEYPECCSQLHCDSK